MNYHSYHETMEQIISLSYNLCCEEIIVHSLFDDSDQIEILHRKSPGCKIIFEPDIEYYANLIRIEISKICVRYINPITPGSPQLFFDTDKLNSSADCDELTKLYNKLVILYSQQSD